jgi:AraC-like DNA-binding protein
MLLIPGHPDWLLTDRQHHEDFHGDTALLTELPIIGRMHLLDALPNALVEHAHPGVYEAHLIVDGSLGFRLNGKDYEVPGGTAFLTKPGEVHSGVDTTLQPAEWYWIQIQFPSEQALPGLTVGETRALADSFARTSLCMFHASDQLRDCFARLIAEHRNPTEHSQLVARAILHELMVLLLRDHDRARRPGGGAGASPGISPEIKESLEWLDKHLGEPLSVPEMAEASGLSQSHFRQRFHRETGFTPSDYLTRRRVLRAKQMLREDRLSITEIAFQLGFQSSPYFAAVFKKMTGITPSEYRERTHAQASMTVADD